MVLTLFGPFLVDLLVLVLIFPFQYFVVIDPKIFPQLFQAMVLNLQYQVLKVLLEDSILPLNFL